MGVLVLLLVLLLESSVPSSNEALSTIVVVCSRAPEAAVVPNKLELCVDLEFCLATFCSPFSCVFVSESPCTEPSVDLALRSDDRVPAIVHCAVCNGLQNRKNENSCLLCVTIPKYTFYINVRIKCLSTIHLTKKVSKIGKSAHIKQH